MKGLVQIDHELSNRIRTWGQPAYGFWKFMAAHSILLFAVVAGVFAVVGQLIFWHFALVFIAAYVVANLLQRLIRRHRPDFEKLTGYKMWVHTYSYPSAHAATSAAAAVSLTLLINFQTPLIAAVTATAVLMLSIFIGVSRVVVGVHYLADVVFGWLLGFVIALGCVLLLV